MKEIEWHDGKLGNVEFMPNSNGSSGINISLELYDDYESSDSRDSYTLQCKDISRFICTLDVKELNENASAGNISNGFLHDGLLRLHLCGGLLEVKAKSFELMAELTCKSPRSGRLAPA
jgi:hypothetical protein|tara:strand:- start:1166 stop:1522 length:357 start_codon:yes stop_codon:yes gene_type:complete